MEVIKSNFATKEGNKFTLYNSRPRVFYYETLLENVTLTIENSMLIVTGDKWMSGKLSHFGREYVEDMPEEDKPHIISQKLGYKTIWNLIQGIKKPYVQIYYWKAQTKCKRYVLNTFIIDGPCN